MMFTGQRNIPQRPLAVRSSTRGVHQGRSVPPALAGGVIKGGGFLGCNAQ